MTAQDRSALIRLASELPVGSPERKAILAGVQKVSRESALSKTAGWTGSSHEGSKADIIKYILKEFDRVIDYKSTRTALYVLTEVRGVKSIDVVLIKGGPGDWMWKIMNENTHPYYYDCPITLINKADPPITEASRKWREEVLQRAGVKAETKRNVGVGSKVIIFGKPYVVTQVEPRGKIIIQNEEGTRYRSNISKVQRIVS